MTPYQNDDIDDSYLHDEDDETQPRTPQCLHDTRYSPPPRVDALRHSRLYNTDHDTDQHHIRLPHARTTTPHSSSATHGPPWAGWRSTSPPAHAPAPMRWLP